VATKLKFQYVARDPSGREIKGSIEAESEGEATGRLRQQQLSIIKLESPKGATTGGSTFLDELMGKKAPRRCSTAELCLFTRQLATMIGAGIPLLEAFEILSEQTLSTNKGFGQGLQDCADLVRGGTEISEAMTKFPRMFPDIYINMVKAGEASGQLDIILNRLAEFLEAAESLKREIKSAMTYPVISLVLIFSITGYLLVGVVPKFKTMFDALHGELPAITQYVLMVSDYLTNHILSMVLYVIILVIAYKISIKYRPMQRIRDTIWLKLPVFGPLFQKVAISRFARTFGTLLSSGVPLLGALEIVATTAGNVVIEETLMETKENVRKGETLTTHLATSWVFPPMVVKMIGIGEKSGALETLLGKISDFYDEQVHATVKALTSLIEPIMLMVMGAVVGIIVLAIFYPILQLQSAVRGGG
jgi:type IV pilus assembly protein PilC